MYFALGNTIRDSRDPDAKAMRREMGERLLGLKDAGSPANNAFIMKIANVVAVEFGMTGHACFLYRVGSLPFELRGVVSGSTGDAGLRSGRNLERLLHLDKSYEKWEKSFASSLRRHSATHRNAPEQLVPPVVSSSTAPFGRRTLEGFCSLHRLTWHDNSLRGGNLAVLHPMDAGACS